VIDNNELLTNLDGLSNITSFSGRLDIQYNASLTNLNGLSNITSVSLYLFMNNDSLLTDLNGLNHITTINGSLNINNNALLANLDGLNNLTTVGSNLQVSGNSQLTSFCGLFPLLNGGGLSGTYSVSGNAIDPTKQDIIDGGACATLPVELTSFSAKVINNRVELNWQTATEVNNYGFEIERLQNSKIAGLQNWEKVGFVKGNGNSNSPKEYSFVDNNSLSGKVDYRLKQIDNDGSFKYSQIVEASFMKPDKFELSQNYPNPFNPGTTIKYSVANAGFVTMKLYNIVGEEVATLVNEEESAGYYKVEFSAKGGSASGGNASNLASGIYFYTLTAGNFRETKKLVLLK
jgi:Secretion system C-terminal sorting domain